MIYKNLSKDSWTRLDNTGTETHGYSGVYLVAGKASKSDLLIFKDEFGRFHFVIEDKEISTNDIYNPNINGLIIKLKEYRFNNIGVKQFIDIQCNLEAYLNVFNELVKDISFEILENNKKKAESVRIVLLRWKSFWSMSIEQTLNEQQQIGLICELYIFRELCKINPDNAFPFWRGPEGMIDFIMTDWSFEIKGTLKERHIHIVNGLKQLSPPPDKELSLISFQLRKIDNNNSISLTDIIESIEEKYLFERPDLITKFYNILSKLNFNKLHSKNYKKVKFEILEIILYEVDDDFPKLTHASLKKPLNNNVSKINYTIDLTEIRGKDLSKIKLGNYFY